MTDKIWDAQTLAEELMSVMPQISRRMILHVNALNEDEATLIQVRTLFFLSNDVTTTSELAKKHRITLQSASAQIQGLVDRGWVRREPDPKDRRQFLLQVTPEGRERAEAARKEILSFWAGFMQQLTPEELDAAHIFIPGLRRVLTEEHIEASP